MTVDQPWPPAHDNDLASSTPRAPELACALHDAHGYQGVAAIEPLAEGIRRGLRLIRDYDGDDLLDMQIDEPVEASLQERQAFTGGALRTGTPVRSYREDGAWSVVEELVRSGLSCRAQYRAPDFVNPDERRAGATGRLFAD